MLTFSRATWPCKYVCKRTDVASRAAAYLMREAIRAYIRAHIKGRHQRP